MRTKNHDHKMYIAEMWCTTDGHKKWHIEVGAPPKNVPNNLKSKVDKLHVDKLVPVPVDLSKLSDAVKNVVKKDAYNAKIKDIEDKIPNITNLVLILLLMVI